MQILPIFLSVFPVVMAQSFSGDIMYFWFCWWRHISP